MNKILIALVLLIGLSGNVFAAGYHQWQKIEEYRAPNGKIVCEWLCAYPAHEIHKATTISESSSSLKCYPPR